MKYLLILVIVPMLFFAGCTKEIEIQSNNLSGNINKATQDVQNAYNDVNKKVDQGKDFIKSVDETNKSINNTMNKAKEITK